MTTPRPDSRQPVQGNQVVHQQLTWAWNDPRPNRTAIPYTDDDTKSLIRQAARTLAIFRAGELDAGATVSILVSLAGEADNQLWDAVADDQGYNWDQIADRLHLSTTTARRRYAAYTNWRQTQPPEI